MNKVLYLLLISYAVIIPIELSIRNFEQNPEGTYLGHNLTESGRYFLEEAIIPNPTLDNMACIRISVSDVIVDLSSYPIKHIKSGGGENFNCIEVEEGLSNITIKNGSINAFDGTGIKIKQNCYGVTISNVNIRGCGNTGISIEKSDNVTLDNVNITHTFGTNSLATDGSIAAKMNSCKSFFVKDSEFSNSKSTDKACIGMLLTNCSSFIFSNCIFNNNSGVEGFGVKATNCKSNTFKQCILEQNNGTTGGANGIYLEESNNNYFEDCKAQSNKSNSNLASGFKLEISSQNKFLNCEASEQVSTTTSAVGFHSNNSKGNYFKYCTSRSNTSGSGASSMGCGFYLGGTEKYARILESETCVNCGSGNTGCGIFLDGAQYCVVKACNLYFNNGSTNGYGIRDSATSSTNLYMKNIAYGNQDSTTNKKINNYYSKLSPDDNTSKFPVVQVFLNDFKQASKATNIDNIEILERPADCES